MDQELFDTAPGGPRVPLRATTDGALLVAVVSGGGGGGGGGGDASAANQAIQIATQGTPSDAPASTDTATASQVALAKRHNVLLSALAVTPSDIVLDSAGVAFSPASCSHAYGYTDGNLTTDTATNGAVVRVKTFSWVAGNLTAETKWVVQ